MIFFQSNEVDFLIEEMRGKNLISPARFSDGTNQKWR